jgi:tetratricopeptide (TPR) repeat protein
MGYCSPTRRFWVPFERRLIGGRPDHRLLGDGQALDAGAEATGGDLHQGALLGVPTLTSIFRKTFEDFRNNYVLRYRPEGVPRSGWHAIDVRVPRSRSYAVRSRNGYLVEDPAPAPVQAPLPEIPRTLADLTTAYERAAFRQVVAGLRQVDHPERLLRGFEEAGNPWPAAPRMEAAFALELAEPALFSLRPDAREAAHDLLVRFSRLVRHPLEPDAFERYWYFAALTMLEGSIRPAAVEAFVGRALERFPDEPRFVLSRAIAADQRSATRVRGAVTGAIGQAAPENSADVRAFYLAAIAFPETSVEARIRLAWFLHRIGSNQEALPHLAAAGTGPIADVSLRYLHQLLLGHVLSALGRSDEAIAAFRAALASAPGAQSARVALMNALLMRGDRVAAEALAEQVQSESNAQLDPWWAYWQGQYRLHPLAMARLRELGR